MLGGKLQLCQLVVAGVLTHCSFPVHTLLLPQAIRALRPLLDENVLIRTADSLGDILEVRVRGYGGLGLGLRLGLGTTAGAAVISSITAASLPSPIPFSSR